MAPRLTDKELAAARKDCRYQVRTREKLREMVTDGERAIAALLDQLGVDYQYEDQFFPTYVDRNGNEFGFCPDFRLLATADRPEQFIEVTRATSSSNLGRKRRKMAMATAIYGIHILLIESTLYRQVMANPPFLLELLVTHDQLAQPALAATPA